MAIRERCPGTRVTVWDRNPEVLSRVKDLGLAERVDTDVGSAVKEADLVVLCTPVGTMGDLAATFAPFVESCAVVTDAGSVKLPVVEQLAPILGGRFVGAHPMAGSERSGIEAAREGLFEGAPCIVTPDSDCDPKMVARVSEFWSSLGCRITRMTPPEHDRLVARISHLPHALAFALVNLVLDTLPRSAGPGGGKLPGRHPCRGERSLALDGNPHGEPHRGRGSPARDGKTPQGHGLGPREGKSRLPSRFFGAGQGTSGQVAASHAGGEFLTRVPERHSTVTHHVLRS